MTKFAEKDTGNYTIELHAHSLEEFEYHIWYTGPWGGGPVKVWSEHDNEFDVMEEWMGIHGDMDVQMILSQGGFDIYGNG